MLATRYGIGAIDLVHRGEFGSMVAIQSNKITSVRIADAISKTRFVGQEFIDVALSLHDKREETLRS